MQHVAYPIVSGVHQNPAFSQVATVSASATWVLVGGQNAVAEDGSVVGVGDIGAQALQVRQNVQAALAAGGCTWNDVVRFQVFLKAGEDVRNAFAPFAEVLQARSAPPLVTACRITALARPDFLLEVACDAIRPE